VPHFEISAARFWEPHEDAFLNASWGNTSVSEIAAFLFRSKSSVLGRAQRRGLKRLAGSAFGLRERKAARGKVTIRSGNSHDGLLPVKMLISAGKNTAKAMKNARSDSATAL
jgi:hypothetical protein